MANTAGFADVNQRQQEDLQAQEADIESRRQTQIGEDQTRMERQDAGMRPLEADLSSTLAQPRPVREATPGLPTPPVEKPVNPKDYEGFATALTAMALIGGAVSKGNWLGVGKSLNGALTGYMLGRQQDADRDWRKFQADYKRAADLENEANKKFEDALSDRNTSINEKLQQMRILGAQYGREDMLAAGRMKSIDAAWNALQSRKNAMYQTQSKQQSIVVQVDGMADRARTKAAGGGANQLTEAGAQWVAKYTQITGAAPSLWGGKAKIFNMLAEQNADPAEVAANKGEYAAVNNALRQQESRAAGIENITQQIQTLEPKVIELAKKVGLSESSLVNTPMNQLRNKLGDADLAELRTVLVAVSREYIRATTAPQSQGQLHVMSQEMGEQLLNSEQGVGQMIGAMKGMNTDIASGRMAAHGIAATLRQRILAHGGQLKPEFATPAAGAAPGAAAKWPANLPTTNAKGWVGHVDAKGNKAYVGPNNEIEEVK